MTSSATSQMEDVYKRQTVAPGDLGQILFADGLARRGELSHLTDLACLGGLAAGVGVNLGVKDHDLSLIHI